MQKARRYDLSSTNISGLGTDLERKIRQAAAQGEPAWTNVGQEVGLEIWRIEQFKVVPWPRKLYGSFFSDDSYIILRTYHPNPKLPKIAHDIFFWIGETSSQDEYGTAAYKTVELDDFLGGEPVQHREVQHQESRAFKNLFPVLFYLDGGVESGFHHVEPKSYRPRLLWVKGRGRMLVREVPISAESLNEGDTFIHDGGLRLLIWHGKEANLFEKNKASSIAQAINDQRGGLCKREVFDQGICDEREWWAALGGKGPVKPAASAGEDNEAPLGLRRLLCVSEDRGGKVTLTEVATGSAIKRSLIKSDDVYILDDGKEVMVWVGLNASPGERQQGLSHAVAYLKGAKRPLETPITRYLEGGENEEFENFFEEAVTSLKRPGEQGVKFTGDIRQIQALTQTKAVVVSATAAYKGSGGPGPMTDMDKFYQQQGGVERARSPPVRVVSPTTGRPAAASATHRAQSPPTLPPRMSSPVHGGHTFSPVTDSRNPHARAQSPSARASGAASGAATRSRSPVPVSAAAPAAAAPPSLPPRVKSPNPQRVASPGAQRVVSPGAQRVAQGLHRPSSPAAPELPPARHISSPTAAAVSSPDSKFRPVQSVPSNFDPSAPPPLPPPRRGSRML